MNKITVPSLLSSFKDQLEGENIGFIARARTSDKLKALELANTLIEIFAQAGENEENLDWEKCHKNCLDLWNLLIRLALFDIDDESKGNVKLMEFQDEASTFEEVLYGLSDYYRDHMLHSLWVYFLGEYLLRNDLKAIYDQTNWYIFNDVEKVDDWKSFRKIAKAKEKSLQNKVDENKDAIWCLTALCHDIGYALSKLGEINTRVARVLGYFDFGFDQIGYKLQIEHQYLTKQFLELTADDVHIEADPERDDIAIKLYRDDGSYWRICDSLERREHGTLSAFILYKLLGLFGDATLRGPAEKWGLDDEEAVDTLIRGNILYAIAQHEFRYTWASELGSFADLLLFADEVEEFSRWGRPMRTRKYLPTLAEVSLDFNNRKGKSGNEIGVKIHYNVHEEHSTTDFFVRKSKKITDKYLIKVAETEGRARVSRPIASESPRIVRIEMIAQSKVDPNEQMSLLYTVDGISADLPARGNGKKQKFNLCLINDDLHVIESEKTPPIALTDWFVPL